MEPRTVNDVAAADWLEEASTTTESKAAKTTVKTDEEAMASLCSLILSLSLSLSLSLC